MSGYQALYRKYRPQTFKELAGQDPIAETLRNEVERGHLAHAYLFTGPRGTGKTTSARLLAKALNCARGPTADPCSEDSAEAPECPQCKAIRVGTHLDVVEVDAASNRGIDDIRSLQERVQLAPVQGRCKVFIIDEVHMLTDAAWNALLKTLEEPPPSCIFVMATTEVHRVLATVLSRCQRFDFQRIGRPALLERLRFVADREGIQVDDAALDLIARRADGGLRDALSLLDQVAATARSITADTVYDALGMLPADRILALGAAIAERNPAGALEIAYSLLSAGHDHRLVLRELLGWARNLMLLQLAPDRAEALDVPATLAPALAAQLPHFSQPDLLSALEVLRETEQALHRSGQQTVWLEVGLLRLCDRTSISSLKELEERVSALERGAAPAPRPVPQVATAVTSQILSAASAGAAPVAAPAPVAPPAPASFETPASASVAPPAPATGEGGSYAAALSRAEEQDVYRTIYDALDKIGPKSKSELFKQVALTARRKPDGTIEVRTRRSSQYREGGEQRRFLHEQVRALWGPETRLEVVEDPDAAKRAAAQSAAPPGAAQPAAQPPGAQTAAQPPVAPPPAAAHPAGGPRPAPVPPPATNGAPGAEARPAAPRPGRSSDESDPVTLARDIFLGKIVEGR